MADIATTLMTCRNHNIGIVLMKIVLIELNSTTNEDNKLKIA